MKATHIGSIGVVVLAGLFVCGNAAAELNDVNWTGEGDGVTWHDPANWSSAPDLPGESDRAVVELEPEGVIEHSSGDTLIGALDLTGDMDLSGGQLSVVESGTIDGMLTLDGGELTGGPWDVEDHLAATSNSGNVLDGVEINGDLHLDERGAHVRVE
ncbi:MAG: hypothetical protein ACLFU6_08540, partial [Candidatus Hydrogenedentota bacterium]